MLAVISCEGQHKDPFRQSLHSQKFCVDTGFEAGLLISEGGTLLLFRPPVSHSLLQGALAIIAGSRPPVCPQLPCKMSGPDLLFTLRNNFYLGAYQAAIAEAADLERLSEADSIERDCFVYRSYIELGSYEVSGSSTGESF